jgi:hypothetical protein
MALTTEEMAEAIASGLLAEYTPEEAARVVARSPYLGPRETCDRTVRRLEWQMDWCVQRIDH